MTELKDGAIVEIQGSGKKPYLIKNTSGVYSCSCPAWRNQSQPIDQRTCKHLRKLRGDENEKIRINTSELSTIKKEKDGVVVPQLLLAHSWDFIQDVTGWWMSEKLDGVRALWDGNKFVSRNGNEYFAPLWFIEGLPFSSLDGELWIGRKQFQKTSGIVRQHNAGDLWKDIKYCVFDVFGDTHNNFEHRQFLIPNLIKNNKYSIKHPQIKVESIEHVRQELSKVEALGGEGVMLRQPNSLYECGRSNTLLKVKSFKDNDAEIVDYTKGKGRHKGRVGALVCKMNNGTIFECGTGLSDFERENPPAIGAIIKFRYQELTDDAKPRFPSYIGLRE